VIDGTGDGDDEILRAVVGAIVRPDRIPRHGGDGLGVAADRSTKRMLAEHRLEETLARDIRWVVVGHGELFEDDAALVLEVAGVDKARREHVGYDVDRHGQIPVLNLGVVAGVFLRRHGVVLAADRVEAHRDVEGRASGRPLEQQVLEKMGRAVREWKLVARADRYPIADRRAPGARHVFAENAHSARQHTASNERVSRCGERQFGKVERESYSTVHHRSSLRHPTALPTATPKRGRQKIVATDKSVCPL
jgi:hypothetical protein